MSPVTVARSVLVGVASLWTDAVSPATTLRPDSLRYWRYINQLLTYDRIRWAQIAGNSCLHRRTCSNRANEDIKLRPGSQFTGIIYDKSNSVAPSSEYSGNFDYLFQHGADIDIANDMTVGKHDVIHKTVVHCR